MTSVYLLGKAAILIAASTYTAVGAVDSENNFAGVDSNAWKGFN